ncbi:hypothetical protein [Bradyrhizobium lablabi]|uniref:hypothetical protein n=1 Tax=Bradyrhizobium lablabi TaxID=722472 RepID=UPI001BACDDCC|nr:hypothetical protein [Bradyrhizobium lablabi]MBR0694031.1 hypothetical protein [Bradyrhizobium lablabi]
MLTKTQNQKVVRVSAVYDLFTVLGFVTPWTTGPTLALILGIGEIVGLQAAHPTFDPMQMLFVNLMGSAVLVWALARLAFPNQAMGRFDALSRALFAIWEVWAVWHGAPAIVLAFTVGEIAFGAVELLPVNAEEGATDPRIRSNARVSA